MNQLHGVWRSRVQRGVTIVLALLLWSAPALSAPPRTVLIMGDSLSAGYGLAANQGWVDLMARNMKTSHPGWRVVNASVSGETTAGGVARMPATLAREQPAVVVIELGANDGLRGLPLPNARANLDAMVRAAQAAHAKVLVIGMRLPPNYGPSYTREFEANFADVSRKNRAAYLPFLLAPIAGDRTAFQDDNLHPVAGVQPKLRDYVWPALKPLLQ